MQVSLVNEAPAFLSALASKYIPQFIENLDTKPLNTGKIQKVVFVFVQNLNGTCHVRRPTMVTLPDKEEYIISDQSAKKRNYFVQF
jgi:hypothetical protein